MNSPIDMLKFVKDLSTRPRGRACIILTHEFIGQEEWAFKLANKTGSQHLDLLDAFLCNEALRSDVGSFNIDNFFQYLRDKKGTSLLIITGIEFLKATWVGLTNAMEKFAVRIEMWDESPPLLIIMQFDHYIAKRSFSRYPDKLFVIDQKNTLAVT